MQASGLSFVVDHPMRCMIALPFIKYDHSDPVLVRDKDGVVEYALCFLERCQPIFAAALRS